MLEQMRSMSKSPVSVILIGLLIVSFAVWGISDVFRGGQADAVVVVGPNKVSVQDYQIAWQRELNRVVQQSQGTVTAQQAREFGLADQLLQRMTSEAALDAKATQLGVGMSDKLVVKSIRELEVFQDPFTGKFGEEQYRTTLNSAGFTPKMFERDVRGDLLRAQITAPVVRGLVAPRAMARIEFAFQGEQRLVSQIIVPETIIPVPPAPTDDVLSAYLAANEDRFKSPERRIASLVTISVQDLVSEVEVPEASITELFEFRKDALSEPETRSWVQISAPDEGSAKAIAERLGNGEAASDIAAALNLAAPLVFEDNTQTQTPDDLIAEAVFAADNEANGASEGRLAWSAWQVSTITPAKTVTFEEVRDQLRDEYIKEEAEDQLFELVGIFDDARASGASLEEAAETANLLLLTLPMVDRNGRGADGQLISSFAGQSEILKTLFETEMSVESEIEQTANDDYYALRTDAIAQPVTPALEDIRDNVIQVWQTAQRAEALKAVVDEMEAALKAGEDINTIASRYAGARVESAILQRGQAVAPLTARHAGGLFAAALGEVVAAPDDSNQYLIVARVDNILPAPPTANGIVDLRRTEMGQTLAADLQAEFLKGLLAQYNVRQDPRLKALALGDNIDG